MPDRRRHRGPHPEDAKLFADDQLPALRQATSDLCWLLSREYSLPSSLKLVGDRYELTARQRTAISRCVCPPRKRTARFRKQKMPGDLAGRELWIDTYNVLTSLEAALSGGVLIRGQDDCLRDMASMHGSYRKVAETIPAIEIVGRKLAEWTISPCRWLIDQPVSNSGRLKGLLLEAAEANGWEWEVELVPDPDPILSAAKACVATADSGILDQAAHWLNLVDLIVSHEIPDAWIVDLGFT